MRPMSGTPPQRPPSLDDLLHLEALERLRSAKAAGRALGVDSSTVYRRVAALEQALGVRCLSRGNGLTDAGRELAAFGRETKSRLLGMARQRRDRDQAVAGTVTLTSLDGFAPLLVAPLAELAARHPALTVIVHISDRGLSLRRREAHLALSTTPKPPEHLVGRRLFSVQYAVFGRPELAQSGVSAPWVVLGAPIDRSPEGEWERAHVPDGAARIVTPSRRLFVDLVAAGVGLGLLPRKLAAAHPDLVEATNHKSGLAALRRPAWALTHPELAGDARVSALMDVLARHWAEPGAAAHSA